MIIGINCGHTINGQPGSGAVGYLNESDETRRVGKCLISYLKRMGHTVYDCTNDRAHTTSENLSEIVRMANSKPLDLFVSIHFNSGGGRGTEVYTSGGKRTAAAEGVCKSLSGLGFVNRGVKDGSHLYVIRHTKAEALLAEVCFVDSKSDADLYRVTGYEKTAQAICAGLCGDNTEELTVTQYEELKQEIRSLKPMVYDYIDDNMPSWAREPIGKLRDKGVILGDEHGRLGLTAEMLRMFVMLDRAGIFG